MNLLLAILVNKQLTEKVRDIVHDLEKLRLREKES